MNQKKFKKIQRLALVAIAGMVLIPTAIILNSPFLTIISIIGIVFATIEITRKRY